PGRMQDTITALRANPNVVQAEPDYHLVRLDGPNDFYWNKEDLEHLIVVLSGLDSIQTARDDDSSFWTYTWGLQTINAQQAWENYPGFYYTAADRLNLLFNNPARLPLVGVIDSGIDLTHPDFSYTGNPTHGTVDTDVANGGQIAFSLGRSLIGG